MTGDFEEAKQRAERQEVYEAAKDIVTGRNGVIAAEALWSMVAALVAHTSPDPIAVADALAADLVPTVAEIVAKKRMLSRGGKPNWTN